MYSLGVSEEILGRAIKDMTRRDQLVAALDVELDDEECAFLEALYTPHAVLGHS